MVVYRFVVTYRLSSIAYQHGFRNLSSIVYRLSPVLSSIVYQPSYRLSPIVYHPSYRLPSIVYPPTSRLSPIVYHRTDQIHRVLSIASGLSFWILPCLLSIGYYKFFYTLYTSFSTHCILHEFFRI